MDFKEELNELSKDTTKYENSEHYFERQKMERFATSDYDAIKACFREKVKEGEYTEDHLGNKRMKLYFGSIINYLFMKRTEIKTVRKFFSVDSEFSCIVVCRDKEKVDMYMNKLCELSQPDGVSVRFVGVQIEPVTHRKLKDFSIPGVLAGGDSVFVDICLKCEMNF